MLVLSRKSGEAIYVDGKIKVCVLSVRGKQVRVGIEAPADVRILRGELRLRDRLCQAGTERAGWSAG